jgi:hypothetical protein
MYLWRIGSAEFIGPRCGSKKQTERDDSNGDRPLARLLLLLADEGGTGIRFGAADR